jgi:hypothetical protein
LRMLLCSVAMRFRIGLAEGEDGRAFADGEKETLMMWIPELKMVFEQG